MFPLKAEDWLFFIITILHVYYTNMEIKFGNWENNSYSHAHHTERVFQYHTVYTVNFLNEELLEDARVKFSLLIYKLLNYSITDSITNLLIGQTPAY